jgi:hypothetical protein
MRESKIKVSYIIDGVQHPILEEDVSLKNMVGNQIYRKEVLSSIGDEAKDKAKAIILERINKELDRLTGV